MNLTTKQKQQLKAKAHALRPIILIGNHGLTPAVMKEIDRALIDHELIKIRLASEDKKERREVLNNMASTLQATAIQVIGHVGVLYRTREKK